MIYNPELYNYKRDVYLDSVGGLLLIYMIALHCAQWSSTTIEFHKYTYILEFFMPWFFFKGGMFFRRCSIKKQVKRSYKRLIEPFIYFSIIGTGILWILYAVGGKLTAMRMIKSIVAIVMYGSFPGNLALWFLLSLFFVRIIFNYFYIKINGCSSKAIKLMWICVFLIICLQFIPLYYIRKQYQLPIPYYFFNVSSGLSFYTLGYILKNFKPNIIITILLALCYVLIAYNQPILVNMGSCTTSSPLFLLWIPYALSGILAFNSLANQFFNYQNILSKIGQDTIPYYCIHWCIIELVAIFFTNSEGPNFIYFAILLLANIILLPLLTNLIYHSSFKFMFQK